MSKPIAAEDFMRLAFSTKEVLNSHEVAPEIQESIISDVLFEFANMLDEKQGSSLHEEIYSLIDSISEDLNDNSRSDYCVCFLQIIMEHGKRYETNVLKSELENSEAMLLNIEMAMNLRKYEEIDLEIDIEDRLKASCVKKGKIEKLRFQELNDMDTDIWLELNLEKNEFGSFSNSVNGIISCVHSVSNKMYN